MNELTLLLGTLEHPATTQQFTMFTISVKNKRLFFIDAYGAANISPFADVTYGPASTGSVSS